MNSRKLTAVHMRFVALIQKRAQERILYLPHAISQMSRPDRMIITSEVEQVIATGWLIEDYPNDPRGHSGLLLGLGTGGRAIHVVCSPKDGYLAIITAYLPDPERWSADFSVRIEL